MEVLNLVSAVTNNKTGWKQQCSGVAHIISLILGTNIACFHCPRNTPEKPWVSVQLLVTLGCIFQSRPTISITDTRRFLFKNKINRTFLKLNSRFYCLFWFHLPVVKLPDTLDRICFEKSSSSQGYAKSYQASCIINVNCFCIDLVAVFVCCLLVAIMKQVGLIPKWAEQVFIIITVNFHIRGIYCWALILLISGLFFCMNISCCIQRCQCLNMKLFARHVCYNFLD